MSSQAQSTFIHFTAPTTIKDPDVRGLLAHTQPGVVQFYPENATIYAQGDAVEHLYLVEYGTVRICQMTPARDPVDQRAAEDDENTDREGCDESRLPQRRPVRFGHHLKQQSGQSEVDDEPVQFGARGRSEQSQPATGKAGGDDSEHGQDDRQ